MTTAVILLANGFETIEALTPADVLRRCGVNVVLLGVGGKSRKSAQGIEIQTDCEIENWQGEADLVVLPGGMAPGASALAKDEATKALVQKTLDAGGRVGAICAAPACVLAPMGVLDGRKATCYPGMESRFSPATNYIAEPVVEDGPVITSQGPATSLAFAVKLAERLAGAEKAKTVAKGMLAPSLL